MEIKGIITAIVPTTGLRQVVTNSGTTVYVPEKYAQYAGVGERVVVKRVNNSYRIIAVGW